MGRRSCHARARIIRVQINNTAVDVMKANDYETIIEAPGTKEAGKADTVLGGDCKMYEYNPNIYSSISGVGNTTGMVFITRSGQEGQDQNMMDTPMVHLTI